MNFTILSSKATYTLWESKKESRDRKGKKDYLKK